MINAEAGEFYVIDHGETFVAGDPDASIALAADYVSSDDRSMATAARAVAAAGGSITTA